jgi:hypothetical protein
MKTEFRLAEKGEWNVWKKQKYNYY